MIRSLLFAAVSACLASVAAAKDRVDTIADPDTRAWWQLTETLSADDMAGRDTGSAGYDRAADVVAARFKAAGLRPAGDGGGWFQSFPLSETRVETSGTAFRVLRTGGRTTALEFLHQISVVPTDDLPASLDAPLTFRGYCRPADLSGVAGKAVICFNTRRTGLTSSAERVAAVTAAGATAMLQVDDAYFTIEPARWPAAYARSIRLAANPPPPSKLVMMNLSAEAYTTIVAGSGQDGAAVLKLGGAKQPMPSFEIPARLHARFHLTRRTLTGKNILAVLPGSDPGLASEHLVLSAHLDGYGFGEPVGGDRLYNGALDDAAYVALLVRLAEQRQGHPPKRSLLFAVFAGEEKGLLGARWFVDHPTVPKASLVADVNLDQLRPLFPLEILSMLAVDDTSLGTTARAVAATMDIRIQSDPEPERGLLRRADHWPFLQAGIPATGFIFGFVPGTEADRRYREWYQVRYHRPQDDITQPLDFDAATKFNRFFYTLAATIADAPGRPTMTKR